MQGFLPSLEHPKQSWQAESGKLAQPWDLCLWTEQNSDLLRHSVLMHFWWGLPLWQELGELWSGTSRKQVDSSDNSALPLWEVPRGLGGQAARGGFWDSG